MDKASHVTPLVNVTVLFVVEEINAYFYHYCYFFLALALPNV